MDNQLIEKYDNLSEEAVSKVSSKVITDALSSLEQEFGVNLDELVIRYVVGEVTYDDLVGELVVAGVSIDIVDEAVLAFDEDIIKNLDLGKVEVNLEDETELSKLDVLREDSKEILNDLRESYIKFVGSKEFISIIGKIKSDVKWDYDLVKQDLYGSINKKDKELFLISLIKLFSSGKLEELFRQDKRYITFWRERILKQHGLEQINKFDENPAKSGYLRDFIRYVMERRFEVLSSKSALWGTYLSALAHKYQDIEYEHLAYGDHGSSKYIWSS